MPATLGPDLRSATRDCTPIVADKMEPAIAMSDSGHDIKRVVDQPIDPVAGVVRRVRSCAMQHEDERSIVLTTDRHLEGHVRRYLRRGIGTAKGQWVP
jgi:hypothetical protein